MAPSLLKNIIQTCLLAAVLQSLYVSANDFSQLGYRNVTDANGFHLGFESVLAGSNFMPLASGSESGNEYYDGAFSSSLFANYIGPLAPRQLQSTFLLNYAALPSWLRRFLEYYFPDYFPPKEGTIPTTPQPTSSPTTTQTAIPTTSGTGSTLSQFQKDLWRYQNLKRNAVGIPSFKWDADLAAYSRNYMAQQDRFKNCAFEHSKASARAKVGRHTRVGENLYMSWGFTPTGKGVVDAWYNEINCYKYGKVGDACTKWNGPNCHMTTIMVGHFTQMMWELASHIGCDVHTCNSCRSSCPQVYVACTYASITDGYGGNVWGDLPFSSNVASALRLGTCSSGRSNFDATNELLEDGAMVEDLYVETEAHEPEDVRREEEGTGVAPLDDVYVADPLINKLDS